MIEQLAKQIVEDISKTTQGFREASNEQVKAIIESALKKMNLVTREEFDVQTAVLERALETLHSIETKLQNLEKDHENKG